MLVLSVRQPWAWAIMHGKDIENRSWRPKRLKPGDRFAIHASLTADKEGFDFVGSLLELPEMMDFGDIIGTVQYDGCVVSSVSSVSPWFAGPIGWRLSDPRELPEPIPATGRLGLWRHSFNVDTLHRREP